MFPERSEIEELAQTYDSEPSFVSLYMDTRQGINNRFISQRRSECTKVLNGHKEWLSNFSSTMERISEYLSDEGNWKAGLILFASAKNDFFKTYKLDIPVGNQLIVDTSPYIRALTELADDFEAYVLVLVDERKAEIYLVDVGEIVEQDKLSHDVMNRHKMGGCSQRRFQRLRSGSVQAFFKEVAEHIQRIAKEGHANRIILAGHPTARKQLKELLPINVCKMVAGELELGDWTGALRRGEELALAAERRVETECVEHLRDEILRDGQVTYGISNVLESVKQGRADTVLILETEKQPGWRCESCRETGTGSAGNCPVCDSQTFQVDILEEIVEIALSLDTKIENIQDNEYLAELGGVAAFLRW